MPDELEPARKGKIGRLPASLRNEVCRRMHDGETAGRIAAWLNGLPEVLKVLDLYFGEEPVTVQNLSEWRKGGFQDWLSKQEEIDRIRELSAYALKLGEAAGGNISDGSAAIAGGRLMGELEGLTGKDLANAIYALTALRSTDQEKEKIAIRRETLKQRDQVITLAQKKFQRDTCALFLKWSKDKRAQDVVESRSNNAEKIESLGKLVFGEDWE
jgi:hypothetical protein